MFKKTFLVLLFLVLIGSTSHSQTFDLGALAEAIETSNCLVHIQAHSHMPFVQSYERVLKNSLVLWTQRMHGMPMLTQIMIENQMREIEVNLINSLRSDPLITLVMMQATVDNCVGLISRQASFGHD